MPKHTLQAEDVTRYFLGTFDELHFPRTPSLMRPGA
jgi:hypothetical protein